MGATSKHMGCLEYKYPTGGGEFGAGIAAQLGLSGEEDDGLEMYRL